MRTEVRGFAENNPEPWMPLLHAAARAAFWDLKQDVVEQIGRLAGVHFENNLSDFDTACAAVSHILETDEDETRTIFARRFIAMSPNHAEMQEAFLELDDGLDMLTKEELIGVRFYTGSMFEK